MNRTQMSINAITLKSLPLVEVIAAAEQHGLGGIAPWRDQLVDLGVDKAARMIKEAGLRTTSLCRGGMFTATDPAGRAAAVAQNRIAIEEAATLGAECLVLVCGGVVGKDVTGSWQMVRDGIAAITDEASAAGVRLAIEPLHPMMAADRSVVCRLGDALDLADELGPAVGVVVDAYHVWWDITLGQNLQRAGTRIAGVHVSDWTSPLTGGLMSGRAMIGDGVIDLHGLVADCRDAGFSGLVEVEILSDQWWSTAPEVTLSTAIDRFERCL